jgi:hypothetical protein
MAHYSYPLLPSDEILTVLREMKIDATPDDLANPTPLKVKVIFEQLIDVLLNQKPEDMAQPQFKGIDELEYPELHDESLGAIGFMQGWCASARPLLTVASGRRCGPDGDRMALGRVRRPAGVRPACGRGPASDRSQPFSLPPLGARL